MRQLPLALLACAALAAVAAAAPEAGAAGAAGAGFAAPCNDDGLAHIPDLPEGQRRPYSVRKRSRTVHRDSSAVTDDTPQLPPGQRRFDAVLPDEQGHDVATSTTARGARHRGQRRLSDDDVDANDVAASPQQQRRPVRRPVRPKKVAELNAPVPEHDAKSDAVVDSYEAVRRYPTHLPAEDELDDDGNLASNDIAGAGASMPLHDQVALEDVPTATTEQRVEGVQSDPDLPPSYRSKFPKRTFASDAGGTGDVLRVKPRKHANQYQPPPQHDEHGDVQEPAPTPPAPRRQAAPRPRPAAHHEEGREEASETATEQQPQQRYRASHRVRQGGERSQQPQRRQPARRPSRPETNAVPADDDPAPSQDAADAQQQQQPLHRQPGQGQAQQGRRPLRRRLRPRPAGGDVPAENLVLNEAASIPVEEAPVVDADADARPQPAPAHPQQRPLRRRLRPRPVPVEADEDVNNSVQRRAPGPQRRRPQQVAARTVSEESFSAQSNPDTHQVHEASQEQQQQPLQHRPRGHGRRLSPAAAAQTLPQVEIEHDGTAQHNKNEPTLVRSSVKKVPAGAHGGDPSPALIQKIVKNTLKRLQPQIAEHEGDVGVDILVKIIEVEDR